MSRVIQVPNGAGRMRPVTLLEGRVFGALTVGILEDTEWRGVSATYYTVTYACCGKVTRAAHQTLRKYEHEGGPARCIDCENQARSKGIPRPAGGRTRALRALRAARAAERAAQSPPEPPRKPPPLTDRQARAARIAAARAATETRIRRIQQGLLPSVGRVADRA
jgi:hypothetical protein